MFTGIIQALGKIAAAETRGGDLRLTIDTGSLDLADAELGDSIAVNGICLTAVEFTGRGFLADVSCETLECTTAGRWSVGSAVNLEPALRAGDRLGGHLVSGHVDGVGQVLKRYAEGRSERFEFAMPGDLARFVAAKGSICIDGTSLTVNAVSASQFAVNIVPHTAEHTIIGGYQPGTAVNLEVDQIARYLERLMAAGNEAGNMDDPSGGKSSDGGLFSALSEAGFV